VWQVTTSTSVPLIIDELVWPGVHEDGREYRKLAMWAGNVGPPTPHHRLDPAPPLPRNEAVADPRPGHSSPSNAAERLDLYATYPDPQIDACNTGG